MARRVEFKFVGDASDLERALAGVRTDSEKTARSVSAGGEVASQAFKGVAIGVAAAGAAIAAFAVAATKALKATTKEVLELSGKANQLAKDAKKVGASVEDIQRVEGAFTLLTASGIDAARVIQDFQRNLADARDGTGEAQVALAKLGLTIQDLEGLSLAEQMALVGDRFTTLEDAAERSQVAMDVFGRSGREAVAAFAQGGDAFREAVDEIERAGIISSETAVQAEMLEDAIELATRSFDTLKRQVLEPFIPVLRDVAIAFGALVQEFSRSDDARQAAIDLAAALTRAVVPAFRTAGEFISKTIVELNILRWTARASAKVMEALAEASRGEFQASKTSFAAAGVLFKIAAGNASQYRAELKAVEKQWDGVTEALERTLEAAASGGPGVTPGAAGGVDSVGSPAERTSAVAEAAEEQVAVQEEAIESVQETEEEAHLATMARIEAEREARRQASSNWITVMSAAGNATMRIVSMVGDAAVAQAERESTTRKEAALEAFKINKAVGIVNATISTALAVVNALQTQPIQVGIALAAVVGALGAVQIGMIAAQQPPSFHAGGAVLSSVSTASRAPDEIDARLLRRETVISQADTRAAGGSRATIDAVRGGGRSQTVVLKMGSRVIDIQTHEAVRTGQGELHAQLRATQPRRVGRRNPYVKTR